MPSCSVNAILYTVYHSKKKTIPCEAQRGEFTLNSGDSRDSRVPGNSRSWQGMSWIADFMIQLMHMINKEISCDGKKLHHCCYWFKSCHQIVSQQSYVFLSKWHKQHDDSVFSSLLNFWRDHNDSNMQDFPFDWWYTFALDLKLCYCPAEK